MYDCVCVCVHVMYATYHSYVISLSLIFQTYYNYYSATFTLFLYCQSSPTLPSLHTYLHHLHLFQALTTSIFQLIQSLQLSPTLPYFPSVFTSNPASARVLHYIPPPLSLISLLQLPKVFLYIIEASI